MNQIKNADRNVATHLSTHMLALFLFLTPFEYPLADLISISPIRIVGLLAMGLAAFDILTQRTVKLDYRITYVALWLIYGLISYLWAIDATRWQSYYSIYLNNALMFLLFSMVSFTKHEAEMLKKSMVFGVGALLLYMTFIPNAIIYSIYQHRLTLNAGNDGLDQNYLAALMLISFGIVFYNLCNANQKKMRKIISIIFCLVIAYYILLTGSRSGIIAVLFIMLLSINTSWKTRLSIGIPVILIFLVVLPIAAQYIPEEILNRFSLKALTGQEAESGTRLLIWSQALTSLKDFKWIFGYGVGAAQNVIGNILGLGMDMAIHNHYIASLVEVGFCGSILLMIPVIKMIKETLKRDKSVATAFFGIVLMAFFIDVLTTKFFWSAMILLSICCSARNDISVEEVS